MKQQHRVVELAQDGHPDNLNWLINLGMFLCVRFERLGKPADLERAIRMRHRAVELTPEDHPYTPRRLVDNLAFLKRLRCMRSRDLHDLECSIAGQQRALTLTPDGHYSSISPERLLLAHSRIFAIIPEVVWLNTAYRVASKHHGVLGVSVLLFMRRLVPVTCRRPWNG